MRISSTEFSSVIFIQTKKVTKLKSDTPINFNREFLVLSKRYESTEVDRKSWHLQWNRA